MSDARQLAQMIEDMRRRLTALESASSLGSSSIELTDGDDPEQVGYMGLADMAVKVRSLEANLANVVDQVTTVADKADGVVNTFFGSPAPDPAAGGVGHGDLWRDDDGNVWTYDGTAWQPITSTEVKDALAAAASAEAAADGVVKIFYTKPGDNDPVANGVGDIWFAAQASGPALRYRWNGSLWVRLVDADAANAASAASAADGKATDAQNTANTADGKATDAQDTAAPLKVGNVAAFIGSFDQILLKGKDFGLDVAAMGVGAVGSGSLENASFSITTNTETPIGEITFRTTDFWSRQVRVEATGGQWAVQSGQSVPVTILSKLRYTLDGTRPTVNSPVLVSRLSEARVANQAYSLPDMSGFLNVQGPLRVLWTVQRVYGTGNLTVTDYWFTNLFSPFRLMATDMGFADYNVWSSPGSSPSGQKTITYTANDFAVYANYVRRTGTTELIQGYYNYNGQTMWHESYVSFPSFTSDLSGATINKVEVYLGNVAWTAPVGTALVALHGASSFGSSVPTGATHAQTFKDWGRGAGRWVTLSLTSQQLADFKSGAIKGFGVGYSSSSDASTHGGRFESSSGTRKPQIRFTYTK